VYIIIVMNVGSAHMPRENPAAGLCDLLKRLLLSGVLSDCLDSFLRSFEVFRDTSRQLPTTTPATALLITSDQATFEARGVGCLRKGVASWIKLVAYNTGYFSALTSA
jgi:hypothetical protein